MQSGIKGRLDNQLSLSHGPMTSVFIQILSPVGKRRSTISYSGLPECACEDLALIPSQLKEATVLMDHYRRDHQDRKTSYSTLPMIVLLTSGTTSAVTPISPLKNTRFEHFPPSAFITHLGNQHLLLIFNLLLLPSCHILEL